ncbi:hypothetical protein NUSPORA_01599 [Nucleospora cyclopteri]
MENFNLLDTEETNIINFIEESDFKIINEEENVIKCFCLTENFILSLLYNNTLSIVKRQGLKKNFLILETAPNFINEEHCKICLLNNTTAVILTNHHLFLVDFVVLNTKLLKNNVSDFSLFNEENQPTKIISSLFKEQKIILEEFSESNLNAIKIIETIKIPNKIHFTSKKHIYYTADFHTLIRYNLYKDKSTKIEVNENITAFAMKEGKFFLGTYRGAVLTLEDLTIKKETKIDFCRFVDKIETNENKTIFIAHQSVFVVENEKIIRFAEFFNQINDMQIYNKLEYFAVENKILTLNK